MRRTSCRVVFLVAGFIVTLLASSRAFAAAPEEQPLWSTLSPAGSAGDEKVEDRGMAQRPNRFISDITLPSYAVYLPPKEKASGAAVVICPGGGYRGVAIDKEGHEVARWLNSIGVAGIVLKYRMPRPDVTKNGPPLPLLDVRRAIGLARERAAEWGIARDRVGVMGFSAGGHLASMAATRFEGRDDAARPDFAILIYPVITMGQETAHSGSRQRLLGESPTPELVESFSSERRVTSDTPPVFLVHAADDRVKCENSLLLRDALAKEKVPCELHLFEKGGHGFGLGADDPAVASWPGLCEKWLEARAR